MQDKTTEIIAFRGVNVRHKEILRKLSSLGRLQDKEDVEFQTRNLLSEIWLLLLEEIKDSDREHTVPNSVKQDRIFTMLSYIHENYNRKLTLEEIAASASVSKRECLRCFQTGLGESPFHYLIHYRIQQAKKLLTSTDMTITLIAMETGFSTSAYFGKIFLRECGQTPGEYRRKDE